MQVHWWKVSMYLHQADVKQSCQIWWIISFSDVVSVYMWHWLISSHSSSGCNFLRNIERSSVPLCVGMFFSFMMVARKLVDNDVLDWVAYVTSDGTDHDLRRTDSSQSSWLCEGEGCWPWWIALWWIWLNNGSSGMPELTLVRDGSVARSVSGLSMPMLNKYTDL